MLLRLYFVALAVISQLLLSPDLCQAQAFFPLLRTDTSATAADVWDTLRSAAWDTSVSLMGVNGANINNTNYDANLALLSDNSAAAQGNAAASSSADPQAEILPNTGNSAALAECIAYIGGIYSCHNGTPTCATGIWNDQGASTFGEFEVLANPTYPTVTNGTLQVTFDLLISSFPWQNGSAYAACGNSYVMVTIGGGNWQLFAWLEGYGSYSDSGTGDFSFTFTAEEAISVGDPFSIESDISGTDVNTTSDTPGATLTTSVYVSNP